MAETSLMIYTFAQQAAIGIMVMLVLATMLYKDKTFKSAVIVMPILSVIGSLASLFHLGNPAGALLAVSNAGISWLSNEIVLSGIFTGITVSYAIIRLAKKFVGFEKILAWLGLVVGLLTVFAMGMLYSTTNVPFWQNPNTFVSFFTTTVACGSLLFVALSYKELKGENIKIFAVLAITAVVIQAAFALSQAATLAIAGKAALESVAILSSMSGIIFLQWILILGGAVLMFWYAAHSPADKYRGNLVMCAAFALIAGQFIGRYVFYAALVSLSVGLV